MTTEQQSKDEHWDYTTIYEDEALAAAPPGTKFVAVEQEWNEDYTVRTIRKAKLVG